jgi:hypothetical protein
MSLMTVDTTYLSFLLGYKKDWRLEIGHFTSKGDDASRAEELVMFLQSHHLM